MTHVERYLKTLQCPNCNQEFEINILDPDKESFNCTNCGGLIQVHADEFTYRLRRFIKDKLKDPSVTDEQKTELCKKYESYL